jgi:hypothetical protein
MINHGRIDSEVSSDIPFLFLFPRAHTNIWEMFLENGINDVSIGRMGFAHHSTLVNNVQCVQLGYTYHHIF